ncbi:MULTISPECIES: ABC transporter permease [Pseudothermotoga]|jgi:ABC-type dipeptide/oligopeptide/nickel transport system permease subunit|uniref:Binding-protein-dependent transport systems inner membrane component n=1 Tax=Pseudothermotoga lettingae (strain ATCC BAA-301 / DSM 14385 / NBRC 107922 / TMO) TaxID=416591 RepID=A8F3N6_PSELT|nr:MULTISPECIES: ABC transporter permease [Pseudothermotoga]ABV32770.1 binding-protein-dependent transport systems inner membrane component [Pseudothermotoga lettingae TMO]MDI3495254.1 peptide/nickel transport system permease protein [Pseudothermotoga sp.]MDK2885221.1 peptide/nickel transport system permease protein [Pseudothermotoga sp.]GLI48236.1 peptide ABC transporter substrate-binding protein [Pseudothermotoga lettingae TMO]HBJ80921.1 ABC transporter permease [Pseudothermotoga sp.]
MPKKSSLVMFKRISKNKGALFGMFIVILMITVSIIAPLIAPYDPYKQDLLSSLQRPSLKHVFGTDIFGRDVLSRVIYGARTSISISFFAVLIAIFIGTTAGTFAGYFGGTIDEVLMRFLDILMAFPDILLAIAIVAALGPGKSNLIMAIAIYSFPQFARVMRASVLSVKNSEYVEAAKAIGESNISIMIRYVVPNAITPIIIQATLRMATAVLTISGLSFLGLGVKPPEAEWGTDLAMARVYIEIAPHLGIFPGLALFLTVMGFNLFGDGLNDALNPRLKDR